MDKRKGFTLIELLVVISIIAMLMSVLIPTLKAAKAAATGAVCVSNQHSLTMAWFTYTIENDGKLVSGDVPTTIKEDGWVIAPIDASHTFVGKSPTSTTEDEKRGIEKGSLYPYIKDVDVYHCPADKRYRRPATDQSWSQPQGGFRTYSIPAGLYGEVLVSGDYWVKTFSQIKRPAEKYAFVEEKDPRGYNAGSWALDEPQKYDKWDWTDPLAIWHNKKSSLGWADGHATMQRWIDKRTIEMSKYNLYDSTFKNIRAEQTDNPDLLFMKQRWAPGPGEGIPKSEK